MKVSHNRQLTKDTSLFETPPRNRDIVHRNMKHVKNSIKKHGFLHDSHPLITYPSDFGNGKLCVADGNHRLQAIRELNAEGYDVGHFSYVIYPKDQALEIAKDTNHAQSSQKIKDSIKTFAADGKESYVKILEICELYNCTGAITAAALRRCKNSTYITDLIHSGDYVVTDESFAHKILSLLQQIVEELDCKSLRSNQSFLSALTTLFNLDEREDFDFNMQDFVKRLYRRENHPYIQQLRTANSFELFLDLFDKIYNKGRRSPVDISHQRYVSSK